MPLPPFDRQMGAGKTIAPNQYPLQLQLGEAIASPGRHSLSMEQPVQQSYHETTHNTNHKNQPLTIPGGVYMISPLAAVSVWAAFKMKLITWRHLCVWIALYEVRTWRDTQELAQRNLFKFNPRRVAQALGKKNAGPLLKKGLADLEQLGLARLTPTHISFPESLDALPLELRTEALRMLNALGNDNITRAIRMPRRLMRLIMKSNRPRPVRTAVLFGMLLRVMPVKRYGWFKGCLTTALLVDVSGFNESRIKHERAALIGEGCFERLETPARVRRQHGDWYALGHVLPVPSRLKTTTDQQPPAAPTEGNPQPLMKKPAPSFGIETNQLLPAKPGASGLASIARPREAPSWAHMTPEDLREPRRRAALYEDACHRGVIGDSPAERLTFYAAIARALRLGAINPCGMLRRIVQTTAYHGYIADCDEDQARAWLRELQPQPAPEVLALGTPEAAVDHGPGDVEVYRILARGLLGDGYDPTGHEAYDVVRRKDKNNVLRGWTRERWEAAKAEALGQRL